MLTKMTNFDRLQAEIEVGRLRNGLLKRGVPTDPLIQETGFSKRQLQYFSTLARLVDSEEPGCPNPRPGQIPQHWAISKEAVYAKLAQFREGKLPSSAIFHAH